MTPLRSRVHPLFVLAAFSGVLFCITTLALLVLPWMEPSTEFTRWLERNSLPLIASEVVATLIAGVAGLCFDRPNPVATDSGSRWTAPPQSPADTHEPDPAG